jgi:NADH dehydrogenase
LAGALGEMSRFTLAKDFKQINPKQARIILIEGGPRILPMFSEQLASRAMRDLEHLGVQTWTDSIVTDVSKNGVRIGTEQVRAATVLWAAGTEASPVGSQSDLKCDRQGRVIVQSDLSVPDYPHVFVCGDQCCFREGEQPLPGVAPVAVQQGRHFARVIRADLDGKTRPDFKYVDKGQMATIGRSRAILESGQMKMTGFTAWLAWLVVHIYFLTGFRNRIFVLISWAWSYLTFRRGARLILQKNWRSFEREAQNFEETPPAAPQEATAP